MQAGPLRHKLTLQRKVETTELDGSVTTTYKDVANLRGSVTPLRGSKGVNLERLQDATQFTVRMRFYPGVTPSHRLIFRKVSGDRVLEIISPINAKEMNRELIIAAAEI